MKCPFSASSKEWSLVLTSSIFLGKDRRFLPRAATLCHFLAIFMSFLGLIIMIFDDFLMSWTENLRGGFFLILNSWKHWRIADCCLCWDEENGEGVWFIYWKVIDNALNVAFWLWCSGLQGHVKLGKRRGFGVGNVNFLFFSFFFCYAFFGILIFLCWVGRWQIGSKLLKMITSWKAWNSWEPQEQKVGYMMNLFLLLDVLILGLISIEFCFQI